MSTRTSQRSRAEAARRESAWAAGLAVFAGLMMIVVGVGEALLGLAGILEDDVYEPVHDYLYGLDLTTWGWLHLGFGLLLMLTGVSVLSGKAWARAAGIGLAMLALVGNFVFLPYYPVWTMVLIALDIAVIWGLARFDGKVR